MAVSKTVRQLIQFVEPIIDDFKCPVCYEILQEPHLTTCCGSHHLCKLCMETVKKTNGRCPFCQQKPFDGFIDKRFERQLNELGVYCIYKPKGCKWIGSFGKIEQHMNTGKENGECQYVVVECPVSVKCKEYFLRKNLKSHVNNSCKYRRAQCMYCGLVSTYQNIATLHPQKCTKYPLLCPNKCSDCTYPRDQLDTHLALCPEQEVDCTFSEMGCKEKIKRKVLQEHLDRNLLQHQLIMCQAFKEMKKEKKEVDEQLELLRTEKKELEVKIQQLLKFSCQEDNQIKSLKCIVKSSDHLQSVYFSKMAEFSIQYPVVPVVFKESFEITMTKHNYFQFRKRIGNHYTAGKPYCSQLFYSHPNGYKLQLSAEVICHCADCRNPKKQTTSYATAQIQFEPQYEQFDHDYGWHSVSAYDGGYDAGVGSSYYPNREASFAINIYIFKGENDRHLNWPFKEKAIITLYDEEAYDQFERSRLGRSNLVYVPREVADFEGDRNYTNSGNKLDIKSTVDPLQPASQILKGQLFDEQLLGAEAQPESHVLAGKGLLLPLNLQNCYSCDYDYYSGSNNIIRKIVCFEVTFSPQMHHYRSS